MTITLTADQEASLAALVAAGAFASIEDAARALLDERLAEERRRAAGNRREVLLAGELSDADLAEIAATKMNPRHNHLNNELT